MTAFPPGSLAYEALIAERDKLRAEIERLRAENQRLSNIMRNAIKAFDIAKGALSALEHKP